MLAHPFPPLAASGSFRMSRFARYLPEFGWQPLVLTVDTASVESDSIDQSLGEFSDGIVIRRSRVLRPIESTIKFAKRVLSYGPAGRRPADATTPCEAEAGPPARTGLVARAGTKLRALVEHLALPDSEVGWLFPALRGAMSLVREHKPNVIFSSGPPHTSHLVGLAVKRLTGLPLVLDFRDPWSRTQWEKYRASAIRHGIDRHLEHRCVSRADRVILNTSDLQSEFVAAYPGMRPDKFVVLPNGYDPALAQRVEQLRAMEKRGADRVVRLCHPGSVYGRRDLLPLIIAIGRLSRAGFSVVLDQVGSVEQRHRICQFAEQLAVQDRVVLHGKLSHVDTIRRMAAADIFVICQPGTSLQIPAKLFEMLPFRRPMLALAEQGGATALIVEQYRLGEVVRPEDDDAIARAVRMLADTPAEYLGTGWREAMCQFNGRELTGDLASILDTCAARQPPEQHADMAAVAR
ncbi:MAG: glycosyltransferase family 4 protein [Planctomycetia bacterium]|nr:glycosyltransferase family 4 protein [Planctomycetia bacterium]